MSVPTNAELLLRLANRVRRVHALEDGLMDALDVCQQAADSPEPGVPLVDEVIPALIRLVHPLPPS